MANFVSFLNRMATSLLLASALGAADEPVARGLNQFAVRTYWDLAPGAGNVIFSPFNIFTALSMTLAGARGQTASEIAAVLGQSYPDPDYQRAVASLVDRITNSARNAGNELANASSLWGDRGFGFEQDFLRTIETNYRAPLVPVDFSTDPERARGAINDWTEQQTRGRIRELFRPGSLDTRTRLVAATAIYFYGKWQFPFATTNTRPAPFHLENGETVQTDFMRQTASFGYNESASVRLLEMKYAGGAVAFDILLPKSLEAVVDVDQESLNSLLGNLQNRTLEVAIPKFHAESEFSLVDTLSRLGMPSAFNDGSADFSGIDGRRDLVISDVRHKGFVDVTEEGTEAAAATGVAIGVTSIQLPQGEFRADWPFVFLIRDTSSGAILFAGRLANPAL